MPDVDSLFLLLFADSGIVPRRDLVNMINEIKIVVVIVCFCPSIRQQSIVKTLKKNFLRKKIDSHLRLSTATSCNRRPTTTNSSAQWTRRRASARPRKRSRLKSSGQDFGTWHGDRSNSRPLDPIRNAVLSCKKRKKLSVFLTFKHLLLIETLVCGSQIASCRNRHSMRRRNSALKMIEHVMMLMTAAAVNASIR